MLPLISNRMKKLYRSDDDRMVSGVLGGLGEYFDIDPIIVRLIAVVVAIGTGFVPFALVYLLAIFLVPRREHKMEEYTIE